MLNPEEELETKVRQLLEEFRGDRAELGWLLLTLKLCTAPARMPTA